MAAHGRLACEQALGGNQMEKRVIGWEIDPAVQGSHNLKPVFADPDGTEHECGRQCESLTGCPFERDTDCVCNVGVQHCLAHPGRLLTQEEKIAFRKEWDERVR